MNRVIKVLLVDDHLLVRTGIRMMLANVQGLKIVGEASDGHEAIQQVRELKPDVVILDVKMPGIGGLEATRKLLRIDPDIKVLILTVCSDDLFSTRLLQAGAAGYLTKNVKVEEIVQAIRTVNQGQRYISPEIASQLALRHSLHHVVDREQSPFEILSDRELQVMLMVVNGQRIQDISEQLSLSPKTVNSYRYRIFSKLDVENDVELTKLAFRYGLMDVGEAKSVEE